MNFREIKAADTPAIHLAAAAERTGGHVYTVDAMPEKTAFATSNLRDAGLLHSVSLETAEGADFAVMLPEGIDFVFLDYGVPGFVRAFRMLRDRMAERCLMFVDGGPDACPAGRLDSNVEGRRLRCTRATSSRPIIHRMDTGTTRVSKVVSRMSASYA